MGSNKEWKIFVGQRPRYPIPDAILLQPNGIDFLDRHEAKGYVYEEKVYDYICEKLGGVVIGPHMLDQILKSVPYGSCRPDGLVFQDDQHGSTILTHVVEAKSGHRMNSGHKLVGFQNLLDWLRKDPNIIHRKITRFKHSSTEPDHCNWPKLEGVRIPEDELIHVVFISPHENHGTLYVAGCSFASVTHQLVV